MEDPNNPMNVAQNQPPFYIPNPDNPSESQYVMSLNDFLGGSMSSWMYTNWADRCSCTTYPLFDNGYVEGSYNSQGGGFADSIYNPSLTLVPFEGGPGPLPYNPDLMTGGIEPCESITFTTLAVGFCEQNPYGQSTLFNPNSQFYNLSLGLQDIFFTCCPDYLGIDDFDEVVLSVSGVKTREGQQ